MASRMEKLEKETKIWTTANGIVLKLLPDGTKEQTNGRGVKVVTYPDGRLVQTNPDGVVIEMSPDKKTRLQKNADGSQILVRPDGSKLQRLADGTEIEMSADGKKTKKAVPAARTVAEAPVAPTAFPTSQHALALPTPLAAAVLDPSEVPAHFICPLIHQVMDDPVVIADGTSYERRAIVAHFAQCGNVSPITMRLLESTTVVPNLALKRAIDEWRSSIPVASVV